MHPIDCTGKVFTKRELTHANNAAIREKRNCQLSTDFIEGLPEDKIYPICLALDEHNKGEIRVQIVFEKGKTGLLDMSKKRYDYLPIATINDEGQVILKYINGKPYPDDREYTEEVVRKVVRDKNFRRKVLSAYDNQCAMCEINDISSLVAAHIYPAHLCGDDSVNNGICLCSTHDKAYESGIICIGPSGEIINHSSSIKVLNTFIRFPKSKKDYPSPERLRQRYELSMSRRENN